MKSKKYKNAFINNPRQAKNTTVWKQHFIIRIFLKATYVLGH